jgi:hypothetical protein
MNKKNLDWTVIPRGGWGDMFVSYANMCQLDNRFNVLLNGQDKYIAKFLEYQDNIEEVIFVPYENKKTLEEMAIETDNINETNNKKWIKELTNISLDKFVLTHPNFEQKKNRQIIRKFPYKLPENNWKIKPHSLLFNPYSIQSLTASNHCPLMPEILNWLVHGTDWNIVLIGQETYNHVMLGETKFPLQISGDTTGLQNLVGKTESMMDVFNIADQCDGIITTSNCLSLWSIISNNPAVVVLNDVLTHPTERIALNFFKEWINHHPNTLLDCDCTPDQFMETFKKWEKTL